LCLWENPHTFVMHAMLTQVSCIVPVGEPIFEPFPHEVTFQAYEPYKTYEARLRLRNNDAVRMCSFVRVCVCVCAREWVCEWVQVYVYVFCFLQTYIQGYLRVIIP
jgi:hypothetical protein